MASLGLAIVAGGCCDEEQPASSEGGEWATAEGGIQQDPTERKLDLVIECHNRTNRMLKLVGLYFDSLEGAEPGAKRVPTVERAVEDAPQACAEARAATVPAIPEVDGVMQEYVKLVSGVEQDVVELERYYRSEGFKTDGFQGAREMHRRLQRDVESLEPLHERLGKVVEAAEDRREAQEIERTAGAKGLRYEQRVFVREAKLLVREAAKKEPDPGVMGGLLARAEASWAALADRAKAHPEEVAKAAMYGGFEVRGAQFMEAARGWGGAKSKAEGTRKLVDAFNAMVDALNVVKWN